MKPLSDALKAAMEAHPDIAKALGEGWKLADCRSGRRASRRMGARIGIAAFRHGPRSPEVAAAIAEANRVSAMLTSARAAHNRILRYPPPEPPAPARKADAWRPRWTKKPFAKYRELKNIPVHWRLRKVVLIWFGANDQRLRVFAHISQGFNEHVALRELAGVEELPLRTTREARWDYSLTRDQYDRASAGD